MLFSAAENFIFRAVRQAATAAGETKAVPKRNGQRRRAAARTGRPLTDEI
jgi:hypothetical protein